MKKEAKNKPKSWFKNVLSNQHQIHQSNVEEPATQEIMEEQMSIEDNPKTSDSPSNKQLFTKDNQDKVSLDLIVSLENLLNDRQLVLYNNKDLESQLNTANETISRLKHDLNKKELLLEDKNQEISLLESNITNKQMSYDQLLEDYKDYQYTTKNEYEKISNQLEKETNKYIKLNEESKNSQYESLLKIKDLEEKVRNLEIENQEYTEQYQKVLDEKDDLMRTINDFTERMAMSFSPKSSTSAQSE
ncbi:chromosome segregation ATPase [Evansella vedderi]|uniref:Chromosome segregation ATPase n=1 Tax=Evansella vedderi TaxID=38282 RepID=A0ABT9ZTF6_9BACI|nr:hypothetical protein [Evansella vedderi]MDQ0254518.1 chromosome segregation ATPase [Evansella vedderi]